ncbi:hypothetical protein SHIRM173S_07471 [Streptomyces hirsutus]
MIRERLEREFGLDLIATAPNVVYRVLMEAVPSTSSPTASEFRRGQDRRGLRAGGAGHDPRAHRVHPARSWSCAETAAAPSSAWTTSPRTDTPSPSPRARRRNARPAAPPRHRRGLPRRPKPPRRSPTADPHRHSPSCRRRLPRRRPREGPRRTSGGKSSRPPRSQGLSKPGPYVSNILVHHRPALLHALIAHDKRPSRPGRRRTPCRAGRRGDVAAPATLACHGFVKRLAAGLQRWRTVKKSSASLPRTSTSSTARSPRA